MTALATKHITEAQAVEVIKASPYGGLEQLALHIYSLTPEERTIALEGTGEKAAHLLNLPVAAVAALRYNASFNALTRRYRRADTFSPSVEERLEKALVKRIERVDTKVPEMVRGLQYLKEGLGIADPATGGSAGGGVTVNVEQNNYYGGLDVDTQGRARAQAQVEEAEEAFFRPLTSGDLPPEGVRDIPTRQENDSPLFLHREDRHV